MSTVNINTATVDELKTIKNIGARRAALIIQARQEKGILTLEDLKSIEGVPNTIWDPLIEAGEITLEPPEKLTETVDPQMRVKELEEQMLTMKKVMKQKTEEKLGSVKTLEDQIKLMQQDFQQRMENQERVFQEQLLSMQQDNKSKMESLKSDYEVEISQLKEEIRVRDNKIKQIEEINTTLEKIKKLSPEGIYSKKIDVTPEIKQEEKTTEKEPTISQQFTVHETESATMVNVTKPKPSNEYEKRTDGPMSPKMSTFDGKTDWSPYFIQFSHIASKYK